MGLSDRVLKFELDSSSSLLINSVNGAIDIVPVALLDGQSDSEILSKRGYFRSEEEGMEQLIGLQSVVEDHAKNVPYWFYVLTTLNCNFGCPICYEKETLTNSEMSPETVESIVGSVRRFQEDNHLPAEKINLVIFGGEPLCVSNVGVVDQILESSALNGWKDVIVTNGSRIRRFLESFKRYSGTVSDFRVTLDGPQQVHDTRRPYRSGRGSFNDVVGAIDLLLDNNFQVKMQTILGSGNAAYFDELIRYVEGKEWLQHPAFQWRIEGSHDYANLDPEKDEISEGKIVKTLIDALESHGELQGKMKFESFKYLGHIVNSFGWLGKYKTYSGPKMGFCEPQKGFHYVFSTDGRTYHCPRTINNPAFEIRDGFESTLKNKSILERKDCTPCSVNTLCGGGCAVQQIYYSDLDCKEYALTVISEFIELMKDKIMERADPNKIIQINEVW
ncbi:MAG: radical SAM protein [Candidatus Woesearchaeota archaeon]